MATAAGAGGVVDFQAGWMDLELPPAVREVLGAARLVQTPETRADLLDWALGRSSGETDWTAGNRGGDHQGAERASNQLSRPRDAQARPGCDGDWRQAADGQADL